MLVRERGFVPLARPKGKIDEAIVAVSSDTNISAVEELESGARVASTDDPDVHMMGLIMLEPADLSVKNITLQNCDSYVLVAKQLISGQCDVGIFLAQAFDDLSSVVRSRLKVLVRSDIQVVHHALMIGPAMAVYSNRLTEALLGMTDDEKARGVLQSLGFERWEPVDREAMEFMIDLVDTLLV
jgi:phosphonate transport system substrate-binding protein